ncbi:MAG TPA: coenzyme A pyrophosphatase, partial [Allosphingosinicella sp.]
AIFEAPLHHILRPEHQIVRTVEWRGRERSYYEIEWEGRRIWGATAAMIVNLSRRLELAE